MQLRQPKNRVKVKFVNAFLHNLQKGALSFHSTRVSFEVLIVFHSVLHINSLALLKSAWAYCHIVLVFWQPRSSGALGFQFTLILRPLWSELAIWGSILQFKTWLGEDMKARSMSAGLPHRLTWVTAIHNLAVSNWKVGKWCKVLSTIGGKDHLNWY